MAKAIVDRLNELSASPKNWQAIAFLPDGDVRTFQAPTEIMAQSWLDRITASYGIDGYVELTPTGRLAVAQ